MNQKTQIHTLTFVMLFALYGVGFGFDRMLDFLREANSRGLLFGPWYQMIAGSLANLFIAFGVFWLFTRAFPALNRWALWVIFILGLVANFGPHLYWLGVGNFLFAFITLRSYVFLTGALTTIAALFALYQRKKAIA